MLKEISTCAEPPATHFNLRFVVKFENPVIPEWLNNARPLGRPSIPRSSPRIASLTDTAMQKDAEENC
jgi:hypothetical protein